MEEFKRQLLDFIEDREEPFKVRFLVESCIQSVSESLVQNALAELESEGLVIWLGGGEWISTKAVVKRALKPSTEVIMPKSQIAQIISTAIKRPDLGYTSLVEFIRDAIEKFIKEHSKTNSE
jgi:DeoR/GlpR family transcriptional regulator of sugar metabolism